MGSFNIHHNFYFNLKDSHVVAPNNKKKFFESKKLYLGNNDFSDVYTGNNDFSNVYTGNLLKTRSHHQTELHQNTLKHRNLGKITNKNFDNIDLRKY